ncbi:MAG: CBS domain-containing protein [Halobacteria archaeon]|nr:CBS domain-containing protein [Halobacteria archaeon]
MDTVSSKPKVKEYMTRDVVTVSPDDTVGDIIDKIEKNEGHSGFPVTEGRKVKGFISANDLLGHEKDEPIFKLMSTDLIVAEPEMNVNDAARVILRSGIQKLPVVDDTGNLIGIISNSDVVRSQIERVTPDKVWKLMRTLESIHDINVKEERRKVRIHDLIPTQEKIYADELEGRSYELQRGLAEPVIVIEKGDKHLLVDGHHRVVAADRLGIKEMDAYVIIVDEEVDLGMEKTAQEGGLESLDDIQIVDYARHPLIEATRYEKRTS